MVFSIPAERLPEQSRVEIRYSPSVASAMVDALPYLVDYPYGCTEQALNRFLPTVINQKVLLGMHLDLKAIEQKRTNLNAQEIGDDAQRAKDWKRNNPPILTCPTRIRSSMKDRRRHDRRWRLPAWPTCRSPTAAGDGSAGSANPPGRTHGAGRSRSADRQTDGVVLPGDMLERGQQWLANYQALQVKMLENAPKKIDPWKEKADDLDAFVYMVLADGGARDRQMTGFLYRDRNDLAVYSKAMFALALEKQGEKEKLDMLLQNISQYVVQDNENQTAYLKLPAENFWWCWYGSDIEAMGYYLKLLSRTDPHGEVAARLAKYLITNRKHASYWDSTRDTAICIEALADYIRASGEDKRTKP